LELEETLLLLRRVLLLLVKCVTVLVLVGLLLLVHVLLQFLPACLVAFQVRLRFVFVALRLAVVVPDLIVAEQAELPVAIFS